jgi:hypothetical protein
MADPDYDGVYEFTTDDIPAGNWEFKVAHNRSWGENYGADGVRDGANIPLAVTAGQVVTFKYTLATHRVAVTFASADTTAPTASATLNPAEPDWTGGYRGPVTVTLSGVDESPGAVTLSYRVDGGAWTAYSAPFQVDGAGAHIVDFRATDAAGNVSPVASKTFTISARSETDDPIVGNVPATLAVTLGSSPTFGNFIPNVARDYLAATVATVTSTAGEATLSVADRSATHTGKLVNGTYALPQPLQIRAGEGAFAPLGGSASPTPLVMFNGPVSGTVVPIELKQPIGELDGLRRGAYTKTLTFTLSTTTP